MWRSLRHARPCLRELYRCILLTKRIDEHEDAIERRRPRARRVARDELDKIPLPWSVTARERTPLAVSSREARCSRASSRMGDRAWFDPTITEEAPHRAGDGSVFAVRGRRRQRVEQLVQSQAPRTSATQLCEHDRHRRRRIGKRDERDAFVAGAEALQRRVAPEPEAVRDPRLRHRRFALTVEPRARQNPKIKPLHRWRRAPRRPARSSGPPSRGRSRRADQLPLTPGAGSFPYVLLCQVHHVSSFAQGYGYAAASASPIDSATVTDENRARVAPSRKSTNAAPWMAPKRSMISSAMRDAAAVKSPATRP